MKKSLAALSVLVVIWFTCGCSSDSHSASNEADLKKAFSKKTFSINDVPANERKMVQGFIDRNNHPGAQPKAANGGN